MQAEVIHHTLLDLCRSIDIDVANISAMPQSGGDRLYLLINNTSNQKFIGTYSDDVRENTTFISWAKTFASCGLSVPQVLAVSADYRIYIQTYAGDICLLNFLLQQGPSPQVFEIYKATLSELVLFQTEAHTQLDYSLCLATQKFDAEAALRDLNYFSQYYLDLKQIEYNKEQLTKEFNALAGLVGDISVQGFMYRDMQGRNVMLKEGSPCFIDFQGGMQGPPQYDVASLLYQAKAKLSSEWRTQLFDFYCQQYRAKVPKIDFQEFRQAYYILVLMRLLQVLGAYGRRGILEKKSHFLQSIPDGIDNIKVFAAEHTWVQNYRELYRIITLL